MHLYTVIFKEPKYFDATVKFVHCCVVPSLNRAYSSPEVCLFLAEVCLFLVLSEYASNVPTSMILIGNSAMLEWWIQGTYGKSCGCPLDQYQPSSNRHCLMRSLQGKFLPRTNLVLLC